MFRVAIKTEGDFDDEIDNLADALRRIAAELEQGIDMGFARDTKGRAIGTYGYMEDYNVPARR